MEENGNGKGPEVKAQLVLTFDVVNQKLTITGTIPTNDTALDMLARATRHYEGLVRLAQMMAMQEQMIEQQRAQRIAESLRGKM